MDYEYTLVALGFFAFCGGLIDAAVGGGGLVQVPALLHALPQYSLPTVFGTNKLAVLAGNLSSIFSYTKRIEIAWRLLLPTLISAFVFALLGAFSISLVPKALMEPVVFVVLIVMAVYTFIKKDLGRVHTKIQCGTKEVLQGVFLALRYGSGFIRVFFLILLLFLIGRMGVSMWI